MNIKLVNQIPSLDGYYLMQFNKTAGLHLVLITTETDGARVMYPDNSKGRVIRVDTGHQDIFAEALFSEDSINIVV